MSECTHANHNELVIKTRDGMPDIDTMFELADFFKVFSDSTRIRIMSARRRGGR